MQFYTFAAFTILAITMGQISQTHADIEPELTDEPKVGLIGGPQISAESDVLVVDSSDGNLGFLYGNPVETAKVLLGRNYTQKSLELEYVEDESDDDMKDLYRQYGGNITLYVYPLAELIDELYRYGCTLDNVTQIEPDTGVLCNNVLNIPDDISIIQRSLHKQLEKEKQQENPTDQQ